MPETGPWLTVPFEHIGLGGVGLVALASGAFVYRKHPTGAIHRLWLACCILTALWAFFTIAMQRASSADWAVLWARCAFVVFSLLPLSLFRFYGTLLNSDPGRHRWVVWNQRVGALFALLSTTPLIVRSVRWDLPLGFHPIVGPLYGWLVVWCSWTLLMGWWGMLKEYRIQTGYLRHRWCYILLAFVIGWLAFVSFLVFPFGTFLHLAIYGLWLYYGLMAYAILRWRFMDMTVVVKHTLTYAALYSILMGLFVTVVVFLGQWFLYGPQALDHRILWMCAIALSLITLVVHPLDRWLRHLTDRFLMQRRHEWHKTLQEASREMTRVTSVDHLLRLIAHFIGMRLRVTHVGILYRSSHFYTLKVSRGRLRRPAGLTVESANPLIACLEEERNLLTEDQIRMRLRNELIFPRQTIVRRRWEEVLEAMDALHAKVCIPAFSKGQMLGVLLLGEKLSGDGYSEEDLAVLAALVNEGAIALENAQLYQQLLERMQQIEVLYQREHQLFLHTAIALASAVDARDPYTHGHTERTTAYALAIADELKNHPEVATIPNFKEQVTIAALLHDVGKIGIPDQILRKPSKLTPTEAKKMQEHPIIGAVILQPIRGMEEVARAIKAHHERFDGKGYPDGLQGTEIPLVARIVSVADTFDSMTTDRPYRKMLSDVAALREIEAASGTQFDPVVVEAFLKAYRSGRIVKRPVEAVELMS